ncbi:MAG: hypothetical protein ACRDVC_06415 [Acidimicrobiales bacterium]
MSRGVGRVRRGLRVVVVLAAGAVALASCGTIAVAPPPVHLSGTPALSFDVPLTNVACTLNDVCVALGTSSGSSGPTSIAEFSSPHGHWFNLTLPSTQSTLLTTTACSGSQCLVGGSSPGRDLLWLFDSHGSALSALTPPAQGIGVSDAACNTDVCALIDFGPGGAPRFSLSSNEGTTWSTQPLNFAKGDAVTALTCGTLVNCALGLMTPAHVFSLYVTHDGGASWSQSITPRAWVTLTSLACQQRRCIGLVDTAHASLFVRSTTFGTKWKSTILAHSASALACTTQAHCVVVGQRSDGDPWLAMVHSKVTSNVALRYVPSPLLAVACGSKVCAAIGVTTLLSIPSTA